MIGGLVLVSLTLVWWGGVFFAWSSYGAAFAVTALGAGWLGIVYGTLQRVAQERAHGKVRSSDTPSS